MASASTRTKHSSTAPNSKKEYRITGNLSCDDFRSYRVDAKIDFNTTSNVADLRLVIRPRGVRIIEKIFRDQSLDLRQILNLKGRIVLAEKKNPTIHDYQFLESKTEMSKEFVLDFTRSKPVDKPVDLVMGQEIYQFRFLHFEDSISPVEEYDRSIQLRPKKHKGEFWVSSKGELLFQEINERNRRSAYIVWLLRMARAAYFGK